MNDVSAYGPPIGEELDRLAAILSEAFTAPSDGVRRRMDRLGTQRLRVLRRGGSVQAGLWLLDMGQFWGGRPVPTTGVAAVGVAPESRGGGTGFALMKSVLEELRGRGVALSALYPATQTLYRKAGYDQAGVRYSLEVPANLIGVRDRTLPVRPLTEADLPAVRDAYTAFARERSGHLDRCEPIWHRIRRPNEEEAKAYGVVEGGRLTGYLYFTAHKEASGYDLRISDLAASTGASARRLLTFLADHSSLARKIHWPVGSLAHPLIHLIPEQRYRATLADIWMIRVVDVKAALEARGYPMGARGSLALEVADDVLPGNAGRIVLEVAEGRGRVSPGGDGALRVGARGLATLYSGFLTPWELSLAGLLEGEAGALGAAAAVFGGPAPGMPDMF